MFALSWGVQRCGQRTASTLLALLLVSRTMRRAPAGPPRPYNNGYGRGAGRFGDRRSRGRRGISHRVSATRASGTSAGSVASLIYLSTFPRYGSAGLAWG